MYVVPVMPTLLADTTIDADFEAVFGPGTHDIIITYSGSGTAGAYSLGYRVETPFCLPEPEGSVWLMIGFFCVVLLRIRRRDARAS